MVPVPTGPRVTRDRSNSPNEPLAGSAAARCPRQPTSPVFAAHRRMPAQNAAVPRHLGDMVCSPRAEFGDGSALPASCLRGHFLVSPASAVRWNTIRAVTTSPATMNCWPRPLFATLPGVSAPPPFGSSQRTILVRLERAIRQPASAATAKPFSDLASTRSVMWRRTRVSATSAEPVEVATPVAAPSRQNREDNGDRRKRSIQRRARRPLRRENRT
jgi:hypothetical protein